MLCHGNHGTWRSRHIKKDTYPSAGSMLDRRHRLLILGTMHSTPLPHRRLALTRPLSYHEYCAGIIDHLHPDYSAATSYAAIFLTTGDSHGLVARTTSRMPSQDSTTAGFFAAASTLRRSDWVFSGIPTSGNAASSANRSRYAAVTLWSSRVSFEHRRNMAARFSSTVAISNFFTTCWVNEKNC